MDKVTWMYDYLPVHMLVMAQKAECRFGECLMDCPRSDQGEIQVDSTDALEKLVEVRIESLLLSLAALESYLGYYAYKTLEMKEPEYADKSLYEYMEETKMSEMLKGQPNKVKRRHEIIMEENGKKPVSAFLTTAKLTLEEKMMYWPYMRSGKLISYKDGYIKKILRLLNLREELVQPNLEMPPEKGTVSSKEEIKEITLAHELPGSLTPGKSAAEQYGVEYYNEYHFFWELLHCYPARSVQEFIQYLHRMDKSDQHFASVICPVELVDEGGEPLTEKIKIYGYDLDL